MRKGLALLATIAVVLAGFGAQAASAGAVTFGADLNAAANNTTGTCSNLVLIPSSTCTIFSGAPGPSFYAPDSGAVTAVRVKVGPTTGPMQVLVMTSLYQNKSGDPGHPYFACCFVQQYGPTFTPTANGVTTVPTSMTMVEQPTPAADDFATNARGDFLALSVVAPNVPIPANLDGSSGYGYIGPAPTPATIGAPSPNPLTSAGNVGAHIMMSADLTPGGGGGGGNGGVPQGNPLKITGGSLIGSTASIPLTCVLTTACDGRLRLTNQATGARTAAKKVKTYGSKHFSIPAGKTKNVKVKLNAAGRKKLGKRKTLTLTAIATIGSQTVTSRVKLKRKSKH